MICNKPSITTKKQSTRARYKRKRVDPLFRFKSWRKKSACFSSKVPRHHNVVKQMKETPLTCLRNMSTFSVKKKESFFFRSSTPRRGALETNTAQYPEAPISYLRSKKVGYSNNENRKKISPKSPSFGSSTKRSFQAKRRFSTPGPGYYSFGKEKYVRSKTLNLGTIWKNLNIKKDTAPKRRWSSMPIKTDSRVKKVRPSTVSPENVANRRYSYVKKSASTADFYLSQEMWTLKLKKKKGKIVPFGSATKRYSYITRANSQEISSVQDSSTFKKAKQVDESTFGKEDRMKYMRKSISEFIPFRNQPYGYPFEGEYKRFEK